MRCSCACSTEITAVDCHLAGPCGLLSQPQDLAGLGRLVLLRRVAPQRAALPATGLPGLVPAGGCRAASRLGEWGAVSPKHATRRRRTPGRREIVLWAPRRRTWWIAVLFIVGSACFVVAPIPAYLTWVGPASDGWTFFVGSLFFTMAAALQWLQTINAAGSADVPHAVRLRLATWEPASIDWWSSGVQLLGTVFFNLTTFRALSTMITSPSYDHVVWRPDAYGSTCFLISGYLAYVAVAGGVLARPPASLDAAIAVINLFGCVAFGVSAVAGYVLEPSEAELDLKVANTTTSIGALAFLLGAALLLVERRRTPG